MINSHPRNTIALLFALAAAPSVAQMLTVDLTPSNYNGYGVSCNGGRDGTLDIEVSGGTPPYTFNWTTGATTEDLADVAAGFYRVGVWDANYVQGSAEITLTEPPPLSIEVIPYEHGNGYSVSCYNCYNGSIAVTPEGGVTPYTYLWDDAVTTEDRTALGSGNYRIEVTDANGCIQGSEVLFLSQPERDDWGKSGNAGTNPATQYIGTSDTKDVVFRTNGTERFRLLANGDVKISGIGDGLLRSTGGVIQVDPMDPPAGMAAPYWSTHGNWLSADPDQFLGTRDANALSIRTDDTQRMLITTEGHVGIGDELNSVPGLLTVRAGWNDWLTLQNEDMGDDVGAWHFANVEDKDRLMIYYTPEGEEAVSNVSLWNNGKVSIGGGDMNVETTEDYGLYVWKGILTERVKVALQSTTQWSDYVFEPSYRLMPLAEVDRFIQQYGHLPNVPSAECMVEDGLDVVSTDAALLAKIEELTLHAIALAKRVEVLEQELVSRSSAKQGAK